jgi:hypothetical protein
MRTIILGLALVLAVAAHGTDFTDLGQGLSYVRVPTASDAAGVLQQAGPGVRALVLDLRYTTTSDESTAALKAAIAARPAGSQLFVLVSPATPASLAPALANTLTLGAPGSKPAPKVVVQTDAVTDRRAHDALAAGTPVAGLISGRIEKERYDEASLVQEFNNGDHDAEPPPGPDPTAAKPGEKMPEARLIDRVLQRAVHLHRALLALRR